MSKSSQQNNSLGNSSPDEEKDSLRRPPRRAVGGSEGAMSDEAFDICRGPCAKGLRQLRRLTQPPLQKHRSASDSAFNRCGSIPICGVRRILGVALPCCIFLQRPLKRFLARIVLGEHTRPRAWCSASRRTGFSGGTSEIAREDARTLPRPLGHDFCSSETSAREKPQYASDRTIIYNNLLIKMMYN
jgi:hypothetical protein